MNFSQIFNKLKGGTKEVPASLDYRTFITKMQMYRFERDMENYRYALQAAESIYSPDRRQLYEVYNDVVMDTHLSSVMESRKIKALSQSFKITRGGKDDEDATEIFKQKWFQDFLELAQESVHYGYSLINIDGIVDGEVAGVSLVPRAHVKPATHLIVKNPGDVQGLDYLEKPLSNWMVGVGKTNDLGVLARVAPLVLLKKNALANWAQFCHLFGMPVRIGKTETSDADRVNSMYRMLQEMSSAAFAVLDKDDEVTFAEAVKADGKVFESFLRWIDEQISKAVFGQTMMSDNGSSRSQSEVHERLSNDYCDFDLKNITYVVNDQLIPLLIGLGFDLTNCTFSFYDEEDTTALFDMTVKLLQSGYEVEDAWVMEKFNIPAKKLAAPAPVAPGEEKDGNFPQPAK